MNYHALELITAPAEEPVSLSEAKAHLRVDIDDDDTYITTLITAARRHTEAVMRKALITQTWDVFLEKFPSSRYIELPRPPLQSVTHIKYYDDDDAESTYSSDNYYVDMKSQPGRVILRDDASWPGNDLRDANGVAVRIVAGYGDAEDVPEQLAQAILLLVGHLYENREAVTDSRILRTTPMAYDMLIQPLREFDF